jgi:tRNA dimethylallyltransferase
MTKRLPLVVIVGPTASGKTGLAIQLAEQVDGEIISADSRAIYRGMDIGTAKPTHEEQARVPHWGLDLVDPGEHFSAADFKAYTLQKVDEIRGRGHVPFLVGGTGLYVDSVLYDYQFGPQADPHLRHELEKLSIVELQEHCRNNNITLPENPKNKRYLIRAIEQKGLNTSRRQTPISGSIIVGIATPTDILRTRIEGRSEQLFDDGVVEEATLLGKMYGWDSEAMTGNIYPLVHQYLNGTLTLQEMKQKFITLDWRLAKRQLTWLRRNSDITWLPLAEAYQYLSQKLAKT